MPSLSLILGAGMALALLGAGVEGWALKRAWQAQAAEEQALKQATQSLKDIHDAQAARTKIETDCSGLTVDELIARMRANRPCSSG